MRPPMGPPMGGGRPRGPMGGPPGPGGPGRRMIPGEKPKDFKGTFRQLLRYLSRFKWIIAVVVLFAVASTVFSILGPKVLGAITTTLFEGVTAMAADTGGGIDFAEVSRIIVWLVALYVCSMLFSAMQGFLMSGVSMRLTYVLRKEISEKINRLPLSFFDRTSHGEVLSRITNDVDTISQSLNQSITQIITSTTTLIGILVMMFSISWQMTLTALCMIPLCLLFIALVVKHSQKYFIAQQKYLGRVNGHVEEMYGSHVVVKAFNGEEESVRKFDEYNEVLYHCAWKSQFLSGLMMPLMNIVGNLGYVAVSILGAYLAAVGTVSVGDIQAFVQYVRQFTQPITQISNISNVLQQTAASAERVFEFLNEQEAAPENRYPVRPKELHGAVEFVHVNFGYVPEKTIIKDFSAFIQPGQKVAIVGPTGAGKTTMVKLLMRFYDVNGGAILVDGHDIRDYTRSDLRAQFGMVLQDTWLYHGTIEENIRYGKLSASREEIVAAAKAAQADHFIRTLPDGYQMVLNEEASNVSQGQKQLLTIARAILADPNILILDEATSSVDTRTEVQIQKAMNNLMKGRTSFIIAHRLSTIRDADLILVMKDGDIVEQGKHQQLLRKNGFYAQLYNSQFESAGEAG